MLSNYPTGAQYDPTAPFNQPMSEDDGRCEHEHYDGDECGGKSEFLCECGKNVCENAVVERRATWLGKTFTVKECEECAELHMLPVGTTAAAGFVRRALIHALENEAPATAEYQRIVGIFGQAQASLTAEAAAKMRDDAEAILRFARVA